MLKMLEGRSWRRDSFPFLRTRLLIANCAASRIYCAGTAQFKIQLSPQTHTGNKYIVFRKDKYFFSHASYIIVYITKKHFFHFEHILFRKYILFFLLKKTIFSVTLYSHTFTGKSIHVYRLYKRSND